MSEEKKELTPEEYIKKHSNKALEFHAGAKVVGISTALEAIKLSRSQLIDTLTEQLLKEMEEAHHFNSYTRTGILIGIDKAIEILTKLKES